MFCSGVLLALIEGAWFGCGCQDMLFNDRIGLAASGRVLVKGLCMFHRRYQRYLQ